MLLRNSKVLPEEGVILALGYKRKDKLRVQVSVLETLLIVHLHK